MGEMDYDIYIGHYYRWCCTTFDITENMTKRFQNILTLRVNSKYTVHITCWLTGYEPHEPQYSIMTIMISSIRAHNTYC